MTRLFLAARGQRDWPRHVDKGLPEGLAPTSHWHRGTIAARSGPWPSCIVRLGISSNLKTRTVTTAEICNIYWEIALKSRALSGPGHGTVAADVFQHTIAHS